MIAVCVFSGFVRVTCARASAAAIAPIVSLDCCMTAILDDVEADGASFGSLGLDAVADRFFCVFGHEIFQLCLRRLVSLMRGARLKIGGSQACP